MAEAPRAAAAPAEFDDGADCAALSVSVSFDDAAGVADALWACFGAAAEGGVSVFGCCLAGDATDAAGTSVEAAAAGDAADKSDATSPRGE